MKVICSSCGKDLGSKPSTVFSENDISHGLCKSCYHHFIAQVGVSLKEYIEGIPVPVATVAGDGLVGTANAEACKILGKSLEQIQGQKGGDVFECKNALLPEGCGNTIHCSGCTIRNTVMDTINTGKTHKRVPAVLQRNLNDEPQDTELLISTEKKGGVVFLKIENINNNI